MKSVVVMLLALSMICGVCVSEGEGAPGDAETVSLPAPGKTGGMPLMEALAARSSNRRFSEKPVDAQTLSDLLWATWGINRPDGRRTAPTGMNRQEIRVYAALDSGVWLYDAAKNRLVLALAQDTRAKFGGSPVTLLYAVPKGDAFSGMHAGSLYQNAGLFCASAGLANVVKRPGADALKGVLPLPGGYEVLIVQSIGWPE